MTPTIAYIQELHAYNDWANDRTFGASSRLTRDLLEKDLGNSFGSLHNTLAHVVGAEWIWLERWQGRSPAALPQGRDFDGIDAILRSLKTVRSNRDEWLASIASEALSKTLKYVNLRGQEYGYPLWQQIVHVVNHSTYHRGQVTTLLRQLGQSAPSTDFLLFYDEGNQQPPAASKTRKK